MAGRAKVSEMDDWQMPVDYAILEALPKKGSRLGYHVLGSTVRIVTQRLNEGLPKEARMSTGVIAQRITRWLRPKGLVAEVRVHGSGGAKGYQITEAGERMLADKPEEM